MKDKFEIVQVRVPITRMQYEASMECSTLIDSCKRKAGSVAHYLRSAGLIALRDFHRRNLESASEGKIKIPKTKYIFNIDITGCPTCCGACRIHSTDGATNIYNPIVPYGL